VFFFFFFLQHEIGSDFFFFYKYHEEVYQYKGQPIPHTRLIRQSPTPGTTLLEAKPNRFTTTGFHISFLHFYFYRDEAKTRKTKKLAATILHEY